ncbi:MAG TPA: hypothetical protein PK335_03820 [Draconibacterium sp.]|nr:hypothetical protein [Draconibacterium sp.]
MKTIILFLFMFFILRATGQNNTFDYFGFSSPGEKIELFAPGIISQQDVKEYSLAISPGGDEVFYSKGTWPECKIIHMKKIDNKWPEPEIATFSEDCYSTEPAFSPDGKYLYFSSSKGMTDINQYSIWRVEKVGKSWGNATKVIDITDSNVWEFHPGVTNNGTVYFCYWDSKTNIGSIYKSEYLNGVYSEPVKENIPVQGNGSVTNPFVDPDERFIITSIQTENSQSKYDTFISFRENKKWSVPKNFGERLNTPEDDDSFDISPDERFLFIYRNDDVYWTETQNVIK